MEKDESFKTKYRRITLVSDRRHSHEWEALLTTYAHDITYLSVDTYGGLDILDLPAACLIVDGRIKDLFGSGWVMATNRYYWPPRPMLVLHDERTSDWDIAMFSGEIGPVVHVPYNADTAEADISAFMADVVGYKPDCMENFDSTKQQHYSRSVVEIDRLIMAEIIGDEEVREDPGSIRLDELAFHLGLSKEVLLRELRAITGPGTITDEEFPEISAVVDSVITANIARDDELFKIAISDLRRDQSMIAFIIAATMARNVLSMLALIWGMSTLEAWQSIPSTLQAIKLDPS